MSSGQPHGREALPTSELSGVHVSRLDFAGTLDLLERWTRSSTFRRVATANVDFLARAGEDHELHAALNSADMVTADGQPLVWLSRLTPDPVPERVAGSDLVLPLLTKLGRRGGSVHLFGATAEVLARVQDRLHEEAPGLRIAGTFSGRLDLNERAEVEREVANVRSTRPDLVLVALGCPKQDLFLARYGHRLGTRLAIGVGASLDFLAGERRRAPGWVGRLGFEWVVRLAQEPRRLGLRYVQDARFLSAWTWKLLRARLGPENCQAPSAPEREQWTHAHDTAPRQSAAATSRAPSPARPEPAQCAVRVGGRPGHR